MAIAGMQFLPNDMYRAQAVHEPPFHAVLPCYDSQITKYCETLGFMSESANSEPGQSQSGERHFVTIATAVIILFAVGYVLLMFAITQREKNVPPGDHLFFENTESRLIPPDHARHLVDFSLTDRTGRTVTHADLENKFLVVDFLFTGCSLTCPAINAQMTKIQALTTNQPDVRLVSLTVDPRDDTPDVLAKYAKRFGADTNRWLLLTGDKPVLYNLIGTSFLSQDLNDSFSYMPGNFSHTDRVALVDPHGHVCGYFDGLNQNTPASVVAEIEKLRNQNPKQIP
jgi:cytochrome oxidase Cu insertion factor (SCO1/SenC/PrrC family)